jgi:dihydrofolate reductase
MTDMPRLFADISISLDGFVAGPNATLDQPLGEGGERLHEWAYKLKSWRAPHGLEGGEVNANSEVVAETHAATGAVVMGRRMFSGGEGQWDDDPRANGWWGDEPPFGVPVFVLTHHAREPLALKGTTFTFVTDGIESAVGQARSVAGERDVLVAGGATVVQQLLNSGLLDELQVHVAPLLLGKGVRLLDGLDPKIQLESTRVISSPDVAHLKYRVVK